MQRSSGFVGRIVELGCVSDVLDAVAARCARALAVVGEPGIGKTRLLRELAGLAERRGYLVVSGRAAEFERDLPFGVFVDALDDHLRALDPQKLRRLGEELAGELGQVFPALAGLASSTAPLIADERYRAHRAVRDLLERLSAGRPLVLVLDDLHWADHASLEFLVYLSRVMAPHGLVVVGTSCPNVGPGVAVGALAPPAERCRAARRVAATAPSGRRSHEGSGVRVS